MGEWFKGILEAIGNFFKMVLGWFGIGKSEDAPAPNAASNAAVKQPEKAPEMQGPEVAPEEPKFEVSQQDNARNAAFVQVSRLAGNAYSRIGDAPEHLRDALYASRTNSTDVDYGTSKNPIFDQAEDGRVIFNAPKYSNVVISPYAQDDSKVVITVSQQGMVGDPQLYSYKFKGDSRVIDRDILEKNQLVFTEAPELAGQEPGKGSIRIYALPGALSPETPLLVQGVGEKTKVEVYGAESFVEGKYRAKRESPKGQDYGAAMRGKILFEQDSEKRKDLIALYEGDPEDGKPHTRMEIAAEQARKAAEEERHQWEMSQPGYFERRMEKAGIEVTEHKPSRLDEQWRKIYHDNNLPTDAPPQPKERHIRMEDMAFAPIDGTGMHLIDPNAPKKPFVDERANAALAQYSYVPGYSATKEAAPERQRSFLDDGSYVEPPQQPSDTHRTLATARAVQRKPLSETQSERIKPMAHDSFHDYEPGAPITVGYYGRYQLPRRPVR